MQFDPPIRLSRLRKIGWSLWDPIGLAGAPSVQEDDLLDEYDSYLIHVVSMMCRGKSRAEAASYLKSTALHAMELATVDDGAAMSTAQAIATYLISLPDGPKIIP